MNRFSRRGFLRGAVTAGYAVGATAVLAACATPAPAAPTAAPAKPADAPKAAEAAKPTAAPAAKPAGAKEVVTLRFHLRAGTEKSEPSMYQKRPDEWSAETGHSYKLEPIPSGQDYIPKLVALIASNTAGDLTWAADFRSELSDLVKRGAIEPVDDYLSKYKVSKSEWFPSIIDTMTINGKMYGMPKGGVPEAGFTFVNLTMFEKAGIKPPPTYGLTFEQLGQWAVALSKGPKDRREVYGYWAPLNYVGGITAGVYAHGGDVLDAEGKKCLADTEPWVQFVGWYNKLINDEKVVPLAQDVPSGGIRSLFTAQKVAIFQGQRSDVKPLETAVKDSFKWTVIDNAKLQNNPKVKGAPISVTTHAGLSGSKYKEITFTLIKAISDKRYAYLVAEENGYLAGRVTNLEEIGDYAKDPFIQLQHKVSAEGGKMWRAANLRAYELETAMVNELDLIWLGKSKLDAAYMSGLKKTLDAVLAKD